MLGPCVYWQNPEIIPIILKLLLEEASQLNRQEDEAAILPTFAAFCYCAMSPIYNLATVHFSGSLSIVIPELPRYLALPSFRSLLWNLAEALIALGISTLDDAHLLYREASTSPDMSKFLYKALILSQSPAYIHFDLSLHGYASVEIPDLGRAFPPSSPSAGYTFSVWMRVEHFDSSSHTTIFGAFDNSQTCFVLIYLEKDTQNLILQTSISSSKPSVRFKSTKFEESRWYHICIAHRSPRKTSSARASLFVNGEFVEQVKSQYPADPPVERPASRASIKNHVLNNTSVNTPHPVHALRWSRQLPARHRVRC